MDWDPIPLPELKYDVVEDKHECNTIRRMTMTTLVQYEIQEDERKRER
jgi:hypothetical protein